jgi:ABC-type Mn2+/Zn2+ transport system ATPase subunit
MIKTMLGLIPQWSGVVKLERVELKRGACVVINLIAAAIKIDWDYPATVWI